MLFRNSGDRYAASSIALHWLMLLLVVAVYAAIELREVFPKGSDPREALKALHFTLGLCVLALVLLRIGLRALAGPAPAIAPAPGRLERLAAAAMHLGLYLLMVVMPLAGWLLLSAEGKAIPLGLPPLMGESESAAEWIEEIHEAGGTAGYFLIGLHAVAALFHHYVRRDNVLARMLPRWGDGAGRGGTGPLSRADSAA